MVDITSFGYQVVEELEMGIRGGGVPGLGVSGLYYCEGEEATYIGVYVLSSSAFGDIPDKRRVWDELPSWVSPWEATHRAPL